MEGCGLSCMKYLLFVFNFIIWLGGLGMLALGIILYFGIQSWVPIEDLAMLLDNELLKSSAYILIGAGALVFLLAFCGCCGAIMESKCLLVLYFLVLLIVFCGQLGAGILASIYSNEIEEAIDDELLMGFRKTYGNETDAADLTSAWRLAEAILDCCGYNNGADYNQDVDNAAGVAYSLYKTVNTYPEFPNFPESCCVGASDPDYKADEVAGCNMAWAVTPDITTGTYHGVGCRNQVENLVDDYIIWIGAGAIGVACVELFCMLFAICLCRNVEDSD